MPVILWLCGAGLWGNLRRWRLLGAAQLNTKVMWDKGSGLLHSSVSGETESGSALARVPRRNVLSGECRKCFILIDRKLLVSVSESDPTFFLVIGDVSTHLEYRMQQTNLLCFTSLYPGFPVQIPVGRASQAPTPRANPGQVSVHVTAAELCLLGWTVVSQDEGGPLMSVGTVETGPSNPAGSWQH